MFVIMRWEGFDTEAQKQRERSVALMRQHNILDNVLLSTLQHGFLNFQHRQVFLNKPSLFCQQLIFFYSENKTDKRQHVCTYETLQNKRVWLNTDL